MNPPIKVMLLISCMSFLAGVGGPQNVGQYPYHDNNMQPLLDAFQELGYQQGKKSNRCTRNACTVFSKKMEYIQVPIKLMCFLSGTKDQT